MLPLLTAAAPPLSEEAASPAPRPRVHCTSARPGLAVALSRDVADALQGRESRSAVALYDRGTGTSCASQARTAFDSASVVKVSVLGALLKVAQEEHRKLTAREIRLTTAMITRSDNAATTTLWKRLGAARMKRFLTLAEMRDTVPGKGGLWGLTRTTARDQLTLMRLLTQENDVLSPASRAYALGLMRHVAPEQRWGVPAGAPATATAHVKNGWLPRAVNGWRVHSVGVFTGKGHDYGMAVLTHGNPSEAYGIATIENVARAVHRDLAAAGRPAPR